MRQQIAAISFTAIALGGFSQTALARPPDNTYPSWGFELRFTPYRPAVGNDIIPGTTSDEFDYYKKYFGGGISVSGSNQWGMGAIGYQ